MRVAVAALILLFVSVGADGQTTSPTTGEAEPTIPTPDFSEMTPSVVFGVTGGHTFTIVTPAKVMRKVLLAGVRVDESFAETTKAALEHLLTEATVYVLPDSASADDKHVFAWRASDNMLLNVELIKRGLAFADDRGVDDEYARVFQYHERLAELETRGVWPQVIAAREEQARLDAKRTAKAERDRKKQERKAKKKQEAEQRQLANRSAPKGLVGAVILASKRFLHDPGSAEWPSSDQFSSSRILSEGKLHLYRVTGYVRAKNVFGAKVRQSVIAQVIHDETKDTLSVVYLQFGDDVVLDLTDN